MFHYFENFDNQILNLWEEENKVANEYGTKIHNLLEEYLKRNKFYFPKDDNEREILNSYDELNKIPRFMEYVNAHNDVITEYNKKILDFDSTFIASIFSSSAYALGVKGIGGTSRNGNGNGQKKQ